jgi:hypothetical protein
MLSKTEKRAISDTYQTIITDFFNKFLDSEVCHTEEAGFIVEKGSMINFNNQMSSNLFNGISIINRVFEYVFLKTKNLNSCYYYGTEAATYYLEYLEQVCKANLFYDFNHTDAVLFVYKKTILDMFANDEYNTSVELGGRSILSNIIESNKEFNNLSNITNEDFKAHFLKLTKSVHLLLIWKDMDSSDYHKFDVSSSEEVALEEANSFQRKTNVYEIRIKFCRLFLESIIQHIDKIGIVVEPLEIIYQQLTIDICCWKKIIEELLAECKKRNRFVERETVHSFLLKFYSEKNTIQENISNSEVKWFVKWLLN